MKKTNLLKVRLNLFDEGGSAADSQGIPSAGGQESGVKGRKSGEFDGVLLGKQENAEAKGYDADSRGEAPKDRQKEFERIIGEEYKDLYTEKMQSVINRRFKESKQMEEKLSKQGEILSLLNEKYGTSDIEKLKAALSNDNDRRSKINEAQNERLVRAADTQYEQWMREASELSSTYPDFDIRVALQNPRFKSLLASQNPGSPIDMKTAYEVSHIDEITKAAAANAVRAATENIKARGSRPSENGTAASSGVVVRNDVSSLTRAERAEIVRRALGGDSISF